MNSSSIFSGLNFALAINYIAVFVCLFFLLFNYQYLRKIGLKDASIYFYPSIIIPVVMLLTYCSGLTILSFIPTFELPFFTIDKIFETSLIILIFIIFICLGISYGRKTVIRNRHHSVNIRPLDIIFSGDIGKQLSLLVIFCAIFTFPFTFALQVELIFGEGTRNLVIENNFLHLLIPFAKIFMTILTVISALMYSYRNSNLIFIVPFLDVLQNLLYLSRGFFLPVVIFLFTATLAGKKFSKWYYYVLPPFAVIFGSLAISARQSGNHGIVGFGSTIVHNEHNVIESTLHFLSINSPVGILSRMITLKPSDSDYIGEVLTWFSSLSPLPTAFGLNPHGLSFARLLGLHGVGIPMPAVGEVFFRMGWIGLLVFLIVGYLLGLLEGEFIKHKLIYGKAYWIHILLWISSFYGFIVSIHSVSRAASRYVIYSGLLIIVLKMLIPVQSTKYERYKMR